MIIIKTIVSLVSIIVAGAIIICAGKEKTDENFTDVCALVLMFLTAFIPVFVILALWYRG